MSQLNSAVIIVIVSGLCRSSPALGLNETVVFRDDEIPKSLAQRMAISETACNATDGRSGECVSILQCPKLLALTSQRKQYNFLSQSRCGWDGDIPKVCCTTDTPTTTEQTIDCSNFDMEWCIQLESECCNADLIYNADKLSSNTTDASSTVKDCELSSLPPEPSSGCCGLEVGNPSTTTDEVASIYQYPWAAIILYEESITSNLVLEALCGGALISGKYVLTAGHCLTYDNWKPAHVRLGDYNIDHADCTQSSRGSTNCTRDAVTLRIEIVTRHPDYHRDARAQNNDIGLVRMLDNAPYTDFIRPICLPSATDDFTESAGTLTKLHIVGWGLILDPEYRSSIKRQFELYFVPDVTCFPPYWRMAIRLNEGQFCADREKHRDSCKGDSGGPLILKKNQMSEIVGVSCLLSCGHTRRAEVFTKVQYHLPWIRSVMY